MTPVPQKRAIWMGSSLRDLRRFPEEVTRLIGYALRLAQDGGKHPLAKPLKGFGGAGVLEVTADLRGEAYRGVYAVKFPRAVYVLHVFNKKSRRGAETPKSEIALIRKRLADAEADYRIRFGTGGSKHGPDEGDA